MRGKFEYPQCLIDVCVRDEDKHALRTGAKKTADTILVQCIECGFEYYVSIHDVYRRKISPEELLKPIICSSCVHKKNPSGIVKKQMELKREKNNGRD